MVRSCCCYRKGTNFQANHNILFAIIHRAKVVVATAKVQIFKQITTNPTFATLRVTLLLLPQRYKFSSKSQLMRVGSATCGVVVATAKVQIFKQITTSSYSTILTSTLLLLPQRYKFSSKSQRVLVIIAHRHVVVATAKVQIFKQITTPWASGKGHQALLLLPQRYKFSSKSQRVRQCT